MVGRGTLTKMTLEGKKRLSFRRVLFGLWLALFPFFVLLCSWPVNSIWTREAIVLTLSIIAGGALVFAWRRRWVFGGLLAGYFAIGLFLLLPGKPVDPLTLRAAYTKKLQAFEGVPYVWGGESPRGLDCSGLIRRAMDETLVREGLRSANPWAIRAGLKLWWQDTTAKEMGHGYDGRMKAVTTCKSLNALHEPLLQPGDVAVTTGGGHVLAYAGNHIWMAADPGEQKVTRFVTPGEKNGYFSSPMNIMRWKLLE